MAGVPVGHVSASATFECQDQGVIRGKSVRTTVSEKAAPCPLDLVNRKFRAPRPNVLWLSAYC